MLFIIQCNYVIIFYYLPSAPAVMYVIIVLLTQTIT